MTVDPCSTIQSILDTYWTVTNTDGRKPVIYVSGDKKQLDFSRQDAIKLYEPMGAEYSKNSLGKVTRRKKQTVTIDIFTSDSKSHYYKMETEVVRILNTKILVPDANFDILDPDGQVMKVEFYPGHYHSALDVALEICNENR